MSYVGGTTGVAAGSAYAIAQSASMGGVATGLIATLGQTTVGTAIAAASVPVAGTAIYAGARSAVASGAGVLCSGAGSVIATAAGAIPANGVGSAASAAAAAMYGWGASAVGAAAGAVPAGAGSVVAAGISGGAGSAIVAGGGAGVGSTAIPVGLGSVVAACAGAIYSGAGTRSLLKTEPFLLGVFRGRFMLLLLVARTSEDKGIKSAVRWESEPQ
jgi:hypothetical protein